MSYPAASGRCIKRLYKKHSPRGGGMDPCREFTTKDTKSTKEAENGTVRAECKLLKLESDPICRSCEGMYTWPWRLGMKIKTNPKGTRGNAAEDVAAPRDVVTVPSDVRKQSHSAIDLMKLPIKERLRILASTAAEAEAIYAADKRLTDFEAFAEDDFYDSAG